MLIKCPACNALVVYGESGCVLCGFIVEQIEGFEAWAPELASSSLGEFFDPEKFKELAGLENSNFWFQSRNELILWALKTYLTEIRCYAEIGCGTGFVLSAIEKSMPDAEVIGTELFIKGLKFALQRCTRAKLVQLDARRIPYRDSFHAIGIFDVLEHIEDDAKVLAQIYDALLPGGGLVITVPQHKWLWSPVDEFAFHVRRYSASELHSKVIEAGFEILRSTSFVSFLLPAMFAARRIKSNKVITDTVDEMRINSHLNLIFKKIMTAEFACIKRGVDFAFGGSRLLVARKIKR